MRLLLSGILLLCYAGAGCRPQPPDSPWLGLYASETADVVLYVKPDGHATLVWPSGSDQNLTWAEVDNELHLDGEAHFKVVRGDEEGQVVLIPRPKSDRPALLVRVD